MEDILDEGFYVDDKGFIKINDFSAASFGYTMSISGGDAKAIGLFQAAKVCLEEKGMPSIIIGTSSGSLVAPILAVAEKYPEILDEAIKFAETLDVLDMFPIKGNKPFKKNGKLPFSTILRIATGWNHLAWQDIYPLYSKVFKQHHLEALQESKTKCYSFGVVGADGTYEIKELNKAQTIKELVDMMEESSRIVPVTQPKNGRIDGGYVSFSPGMWLLKRNPELIKEYVSIYSKTLKESVSLSENWDSNIIGVIQQSMIIATNYLGIKDAMIEELLCDKYKIPYTRIECPDGIIDEMYETDDEQLRAFGLASARVAYDAINQKNE